MTIISSTARVSFSCDGVTNTFPVPIQAYLNTDFEVIHSFANGSQGTLTLNSDYTLVASGTLSPQQWTMTTTVVYPTGDTLQVIINPTQTQLSQYVQGQPFPSPTVQQNLDRLTQMVLRLQDQINRTIRAPDGDRSPALVLPPASQRELMFLTTDAAGNISVAQAVPSGTLSRATIGFFFLPQTAAESAAGVVPTNYYKFEGDPMRYGALYDGATDATAAMVQACAVGQEILISGPLALASASLAALPNNALTLLSNTNVRFINTGGATAGGSIVITGTTGCNVFYSLNQTNIRIYDPVVTGIGAAGVTFSTGYFWYCQANASATGNMYNCRVSGGTLTNFAGLYWVYFDNSAGTTYRMSGCGMNGTICISQSGNCQGPASQTITACIVGFSGSDTVSYYGIVEARVYDIVVYGQYIKEVCIFWSGVARSKAYSNIVNSVGTDASISNDCISYAFLAYDHSHGAALAPDLCEFYDNDIQGVRDCGIYGAAANRIYTRGNVISGQISTANGLIPKGGIVMSNCVEAISSNDKVDSCVFGFSVVVTTGCYAEINNATATGIAGNSIGMLLQPAGSGQVGHVSVNGYRATGNVASGCVGLRHDSNSTVGFASLSLKNIEIETCYNSLVQSSSDASVPNLGFVTIDGVILRSYANLGLSHQNCSNAATRSTLQNIEFQGPSSASQDLLIINSQNLNVSNIRFRDRVSGTNQCWYGSGARGTVEGVKFINVASARKVSNATDLGGALPTWIGNDNDFVQNLNPTVVGSGGFGTVNQKNFTAGWQYDVSNASWTPDVHLTGT